MIKESTHAKEATNEVEILPNWYTTEQFTGDEMIDAYFLGKEKGVEQGWDIKFKIIANQFRKNVETAVKISEDLYAEVLSNKIQLKTIHLKSDGVDKFTSLFVADIKDYDSDDFLKVHSIARKYMGNRKSEDFYISFLFMPNSDPISTDCITADGYFLSYDKNK